MAFWYAIDWGTCWEKSRESHLLKLSGEWNMKIMDRNKKRRRLMYKIWKWFGVVGSEALEDGLTSSVPSVCTPSEQSPIELSQERLPGFTMERNPFPPSTHKASSMRHRWIHRVSFLVLTVHEKKQQAAKTRFLYLSFTTDLMPAYESRIQQSQTKANQVGWCIWGWGRKVYFPVKKKGNRGAWVV